MWPTKIHIKPERALKGILDTKKQSLVTFIFPNGLCLMAAHCGSFKRGFPDSAVAEKKLHYFGMLAFWAMLLVQSLALSGSWAFKWGSVRE